MSNFPLAPDFVHFDPSQRVELEQAFDALKQYSASPVGLTPPGFRTSIAANLSITSGTDPFIITGWKTSLPSSDSDGRLYDTFGGTFDSTGTNFTLSVQGLYLIILQIAMAGGAGAIRYAGIQDTKWASGLSWHAYRQFPAMANNQIEQVSAIFPILPGTTRVLNCGVYQNSGGPLNLFTADTWLHVAKIG